MGRRPVLMPSREKSTEQFVIEGHKVFSNKLQGRLEFRGRDEQELVDLAQTLLNVHFELLVASGMALAIGIFFFEGLGGGADIVPVFLHDQIHGGVIIGFLGAGSLLEFGIPKSL